MPDPLQIALSIFVIGFLIFYFSRQFTIWLTNKKSIEWNKNISPCPDYWEKDGPTCKDTKKLTTINGCSPVSFDAPIYTNSVDGDIQKCMWAKKCGASWDGIDNLCI
jgi:hypothetical protein